MRGPNRNKAGEPWEEIDTSSPQMLPAKQAQEKMQREKNAFFGGGTPDLWPYDDNREASVNAKPFI
jgi:hypothetical protein